MKIHNKTKWRTKHLRAIISEVMKRSPTHLRDSFKQHKYRAKLDVTVAYHRHGMSNGCGGFGWYNSWSIKLLVSSHEVDRVDLARTIAHELAHTLDYKHSDMKGPLFTRVGNWREIYAWAESFPLGQEQPKAKPKGTDLQLVRYNRVLNAQGRWETKLKRAQNALKKLRTQRRYYESKLAAKGVL